jgi:K+-sensing histidine kinase KdpD
MADAPDPLRQLVHDLRSPLAIVDGFAGLLERGGATLDPERRADYAKRIREAAEEMRDLLDATRAR